MADKGVFVCLEGLDGCGKTTQAKLLVSRLEDGGYDAVYTAEPSSGNVGKFIRKHCLYGEERVSSVVEALLFAADRFEHVANEVTPSLEQGKLVVSDRYLYSSLAYQGAAGLDLKWIETINCSAVIPDLAIFIDVDPEIVIRRLKRKRSVMEKVDTLHKVREIYLRFVEKGDLVKIDGNRSMMEVAHDIFHVAAESIGR